MEKFNHLNALQESLGREQERLANAKNQNERDFRLHRIAMVQKEIAGEYKFLGMEKIAVMSDDELLAELGV
jgi:hypothetical protein